MVVAVTGEMEVDFLEAEVVVGEVMETLAVDGEEYKRFIQFRQLTDCTGFFFRHFVGSKICDDEEKKCILRLLYMEY